MDVSKLDMEYLTNEFHHVSVGPSSKWIVEGLVKNWCDDNPMPENFDENNSWHWAIAEMHNLRKQLEK